MDRPGREVVIAILRVVEMESAEAAHHRQATDDLFDVRVREMVPEVDEAGRTLARRLRQKERGPPILVDRRVERWLVRLVLRVQVPSFGEVIVDPREPVGDPFELGAETR